LALCLLSLNEGVKRPTDSKVAVTIANCLTYSNDGSPYYFPHDFSSL